MRSVIVLTRSIVGGLAAGALLLGVGGSAVAVGSTTATTATTVTPATSTETAASAATITAAPQPVVHRVDIDGDRRRDTVRLTRHRMNADWYTFRITVETARGQRAIRDAMVPRYDDGSLTPADVWGGVAHLDGARGAEIRIEQGGNVGDFPWPHVYTWRNGRIVPALAPGAPTGQTGWTVSEHFLAINGYTFSTVRGERRVVVHDLTGRFGKDDNLTYSGTHTTYRWRGDAWRRVSTVKTGRLSEVEAYDYAGWNGIVWGS